MDLPSNTFPFPPLITISGAMLPGPGTTGPPLPPLVSIRSLPSSAAHEVPKEPQQADPAQLLQAGDKSSLGGAPEQQGIWAGLQEAQRQHHVLESLEREHRSHLINMDNEIRDSLQNSQELNTVLGGALDRAQRFHQIADDSVKQATDLTEIHAELALLQKQNEDLQKQNEDLQKLNEDLKKERRAMFEHNAETARRKFQVDDKAKQLEAQVLQTSDEARELKSQLATLELERQRLEGEADTLRINNEKLQNDLDKPHDDYVRLEKEKDDLKSQLATSEGKVKEVEQETGTLRNNLVRLQNGHDQLEKENASLKSQHDSSEGKVKELEKEAGTLRSKHDKLQEENRTIPDLRSRLDASEGKVEQLENEAGTLRSEHDKLQEENKTIPDLRSRLDASEGEVKQLENEAGTLRSKHDELRSSFDKLQEENKTIPGLQSRLDALEGEVKQLENKSETVRNENQELKDSNHKLRRHLHTGSRAAKLCAKLNEQLKGANASKRVYLEKYLSLRGAIRTVCRIRTPQAPPNPKDPDAVQIEISEDTDGACLEVSRKEKSAMSTRRDIKKAWVLDRVFSATDDNDVVWEETRPLLESAMDGAQVVVIFYGRTGTGKSFTSQGIWSHLAGLLFADTDNSGRSDSSDRGGNEEESTTQGDSSDRGGNEEESTTQGDSSSDAGDPGEEKTRLWSVELYCGELRDLLVTTQGEGARESKLTLPKPKSNGILHPVRQCGASSTAVSDRESLDTLLKQVAQARTSGETRANKNSSRSHSFTCLELPDGGSITLVDLAGHERAGVGDSNEELKSINGSLMSLTQALGKLVQNVPKAGVRAPQAQAQASPKNVKSVWASPELLPRIVGALMHRGSSQDRGQELKSKVMFLATVDFSTVESTMGSEHTLDDLQRVELIRKK